MSLRTVLLAAAVLTCALSAGAAPPASSTPLPPVRHVFLLLLENQSYGVTFGANSPAPYLAHELPTQGALLSQYFGIGHASLDNYLALLSGQAPNEATQLDCAAFSDFKPSATALNADGQLTGVGCVYPKIVRTLPDQLEAAGFSWKGYMEDMGNNPQRESKTCGHAALDQPDHTHMATVGDQYAARHDPFVYFHTIIDDRTRCDARVVNLELLPQDLASLATTPNFSFITPNLCNDGHDARCVDGRQGGLPAVNAFLKQWVPLITSSPAFKADGLLIITFDESDGEGTDGSSACCNEKPLPGARYQPGFRGPGGGRIGAVVLSPFVKPKTVSSEPYNHYALLRTVEALFGLPYLGYAGAADLKPFGADVFTGAAPHPPAQ
jgi:phosphatidylinositol-3-phosphatase